MLPVAAELVKRGNIVRFYSFGEFGEKIKATGAAFVSCSAFLPKLTEKEETKLKNISLTEMSIQDIRITLNMNDFLEKELKEFQPDVIYTDSVCFWGKLNAWKFNVPMVVSTSTFAFNQMSSGYMKQTPQELGDMIFGLPKIAKELKTLEPYGYHVKRTLDLVQSDNNTDSVVYTTRRFQPCVESFSNHYAFVGPSLFSDKKPDKKKDRPLVYISLGTVINERPDFYKNCMKALGDMNIDVIISCGSYLDRSTLGEIPANVQVFPYVNQLDILAGADAFISHCGMNSASESMYLATPLVLYPQTGEQYAVARKVSELGAGTMLKDDSPEGIKAAVSEVLNNPSYAKAAKVCSDDFRSAPGAAGAAQFIENAPHTSSGTDLMKELGKANILFQVIYWLVAAGLILLLGFTVGWQFVWIIGVAAGILTYPVGQAVQKLCYKSLAKKVRREHGDTL